MLITLYEERPCVWDVSDKDYMNKDGKEVAYSQIDLLMSDKYDISREDYKSKWKSVCRYTHAQLLCFRNDVSSFCHWGSKTFCLFPASLATQGNITRNNVSATMKCFLVRPGLKNIAVSSLPDRPLIMPKRYPHCALVSNCAHALYEIPPVFNIGMLSVFTWELLPFSCWIGSMTEPRSAKTELSEVQLGGYHRALADPGQF